MTELEKEVQYLRRRNAELEDMLALMIEVYRACGFCKWLDADCSPTDKSCHPEWHGKTVKTDRRYWE